MPSVNSASVFDHERLDTKIVNPATTMSGPNRPGRYRHATSPAPTYPRIIQAISSACTPGVSTWSLSSASTTEIAAAQQPATAISTSTRALGGRAAPASALTAVTVPVITSIDLHRILTTSEDP